jgi:hypothetical protein
MHLPISPGILSSAGPFHQPADTAFRMNCPIDIIEYFFLKNDKLTLEINQSNTPSKLAPIWQIYLKSQNNNE